MLTFDEIGKSRMETTFERDPVRARPLPPSIKYVLDDNLNASKIIVFCKTSYLLTYNAKQ
jgi:hypothetical protein